MPAPRQTRFIGCYEIIRPLGNGGERQVYEAMCVQATSGVNKGDRVALSCLKSGDLARFEREVGILKLLSHPNIIQFKHSFTHPGEAGMLLCVVTELLEGETLAHRIAAAPQGRGLAWLDAWPVLEQVLKALQESAARGVTHGDIKPSNVFVCRDGTVKVIDFGVAHRTEADQPMASPGAGAGSLDFLAPEFGRREPQFKQSDECSDVFSFGVLLHQTITGRLPFPPITNGPFEHVSRWSTAQQPSLDLSAPVFRIWPGIRACIAACLQLDRAKRLRSFCDVARLLASVQPIRVPPLDAPDAYEYIDVIGSGAFGDVFRARHSRQGKVLGDVVVKRLVQARYSRRLEREAEILRRLKHPHLIHYVDFRKVETEAGPQFFLITEYLEGEASSTLRSRIDRNPSGVNPVELLPLFVGYLDALEFLHQEEIIHRDIRPQNLYAPDGKPERGKIFDLGIALDQSATDTTVFAPGAWDYMAPELSQAGNERGTPQSDIFAVGVTLCEALTGRLPLPSCPTLQDYMDRCLRPPAKELALADHAVWKNHPALQKILLRAMAQNPTDRFATARALKEELVAVLRGASTVSNVAWVPSAGGAKPPPLPASPRSASQDQEETKDWVPCRDQATATPQPSGTKGPRPEPPKATNASPDKGKPVAAGRSRLLRSVLAAGLLGALILAAWGSFRFLESKAQNEKAMRLRAALVSTSERVKDPELSELLHREADPKVFLAGLEAWWRQALPLLPRVEPGLSNLIVRVSGSQLNILPWSEAVFAKPELVWDRQAQKAKLAKDAQDLVAGWKELGDFVAQRSSAQEAHAALNNLLVNFQAGGASASVPQLLEAFRTNRVAYRYMSAQEQLRWEADHNKIGMLRLFGGKP